MSNQIEKIKTKEYTNLSKDLILLLIEENKKLRVEIEEHNAANLQLKNQMDEFIANIEKCKKECVQERQEKDRLAKKVEELLVKNEIENRSKDEFVKEALESLRSQAGYLLKQGKKVRNWKRRWFVFREDFTFSYYKDYEDKKPLKTIDLSQEKFLDVKPDISQGKAFTFKVVTPERTFYFSATNEEEKQRWISFVRKWFEVNRTFHSNKC